MVEKKWVVWTDEGGIAENLQETLQIEGAFCDLLAARGIDNRDKAIAFFRPRLNALHDPFLMKDMQLAVDRIMLAIRQKQKILVYGDYDVDGTTSVAVLISFLKKFHDNLDFYIPHRFKEGYGVSEAGIQFAIDQKVDVLITIDCGIKSARLLKIATDNNIDVIICDHHLPDENDLPQVLAILNPKQAECNYPSKELCGCGIGFKLISALEQAISGEQKLCYQNLDLVATAIAADIVPVTDENRILAFYGLVKANTNPNIAIQALRASTKLNKEFTISDLVFVIAPRINAAGRMDIAKTAVDLFLAENIGQAEALAEILNENNLDRRDADKTTSAEALELLSLEPEDAKSTVLMKEDWHKGVVGIVASRMIEHKYQPTIILTESDGKYSGSARSIPGLNLFEALNACAEYLNAYGGHYFAAGLTLSKENLIPFKEAFNKYVDTILEPEDYIPKIHIDAVLSFNSINMEFYSFLKQFEPFGPENMRPVFMSKRIYNMGSSIAKDKHIRFMVSQDKNKIVQGIGFGLAEKYKILSSNEPIDIVYTLGLNTFRDLSTIQLQVIDIRPSI